jgi:uncharacterized protein
MRRIETLSIVGPAGNLEALLEEPEVAEPQGAALICHPHPQHGGTMHNKVVYRIARGLRKAGFAVLRFNYRGVNLSQGEFGNWVGEKADALAAFRHLRREYPKLPLVVGGFSFGARISMQLVDSEVETKDTLALLPVGFPTRYQSGPEYQQLTNEKFFIHSTIDEFGPKLSLDGFFAALPDPKHLEYIEAGDHFFEGKLVELEAVVERTGRFILGH